MELISVNIFLTSLKSKSQSSDIIRSIAHFQYFLSIFV